MEIIHQNKSIAKLIDRPKNTLMEIKLYSNVKVILQYPLGYTLWVFGALCMTVWGNRTQTIPQISWNRIIESISKSSNPLFASIEVVKTI